MAMKDNDNESSDRRRYSLFPKALSDTLSHLVKPIYKKHGFAEHRILTQWPLIVGEELVGCCLPQKLTRHRGKEGGATLSILVSSARALELQHMQPVILDRIAGYFGYSAVTRLSLTQTSASLLQSKAKPASRKTATGSAFAELAADCEDESLKKALSSLGDALAGIEK
jgi:hypothetical protein